MEKDIEYYIRNYKSRKYMQIRASDLHSYIQFSLYFENNFMHISFNETVIKTHWNRLVAND